MTESKPKKTQQPQHLSLEEIIRRQEANSKNSPKVSMDHRRPTVIPVDNKLKKN